MDVRSAKRNASDEDIEVQGFWICTCRHEAYVTFLGSFVWPILLCGQLRSPSLSEVVDLFLAGNRSSSIFALTML